MDERILEVGGMRWFVRERARAGAARPPLLLLHGFAGDGRLWDPLAAALADRPLVMPDLPGHGLSTPPPAGWRLETLAASLEALLDACAVPAADVAGYSMGGRAALVFATRTPARVRRLALISASPGIADDEERRARAESDETLAFLLEKEGIEAFVDRWENLPLFESARTLPQATRSWLRGLRLEQDPRGLAGALRAFGAGRMNPCWDALSRLTMPVLLAAGALDPKYAALAVEMGAAIAEAQVRILPRAGHLLPVEAPQELAREIEGFLASQAVS